MTLEPRYFIKKWILILKVAVFSMYFYCKMKRDKMAYAVLHERGTKKKRWKLMGVVSFQCEAFTLYREVRHARFASEVLRRESSGN